MVHFMTCFGWNAVYMVNVYGKCIWNHLSSPIHLQLEDQLIHQHCCPVHDACFSGVKYMIIDGRIIPSEAYKGSRRSEAYKGSMLAMDEADTSIA